MIIYNGIKLNTIVIKSGTLLFRTITTDENNILRDYYGKQEDKENYCLAPYYSIFLYYNPYFFDTNQWANNKTHRWVAVYKLQYDIKLINFNKSDIIREDPILIDKGILIKCNNIKLCNYTGIKSDYCFTLDFMTANPDILGMHNTVKIDAKHYDDIFSKNPKDNKYKINPNIVKPFTKYIKKEKIYGSKKELYGPPEISIYPLKKRLFTEIITEYKYKNFDMLHNNIINNITNYNLLLLEYFNHQPFKKDKLLEFIKTKCNYDTKTGIFKLIN